MKTNRLLTILLILTLALSVTLLVGCGCEHANTEWQWDANSHKQVCTDCNKVLGTANSHDWAGVSCSVCQMGAEYAQGLEYELSSNGAYYTVTGKGTFTGEILNIAPSYFGVPVKRIAANAFLQNLTIKQITLPSTIDYIGEAAFACCNMLRTVNLPQDCVDLTIGRLSFAQNPNMADFTIPSGVVDVKEGAFVNCEALLIYCQTDKAHTSAWHARWNAGNNPVVYNCETNDKASDGYVYVTHQGLRYVIAGGQAKVTKQIEDLTVAHIVAKVPYNGSNYTVTEIMDAAFAEVASGDPNAKEWALKELTIDENSQIKVVGERAFENCIYVKSIILPATVTEIGECAFRHCWSLESFVIPPQVTHLKANVFQACEKMEEFVIPKAVNKIDSLAFYECYGLKRVVFEEVSGWTAMVDTGTGSTIPVSLAKSDLSNAETAAQFLTQPSQYLQATWRRS